MIVVACERESGQVVADEKTDKSLGGKGGEG